MAPSQPPPNPTCSSPENDTAIHPRRCWNPTCKIALYCGVLLPITDVAAFIYLILFYKHLYSADCASHRSKNFMRPSSSFAFIIKNSLPSIPPLPSVLPMTATAALPKKTYLVTVLPDPLTLLIFLDYLAYPMTTFITCLSPVRSARALFTLPPEPRPQPHRARHLPSQRPPACLCTCPSLCRDVFPHLGPPPSWEAQQA